MMAEALPGPGCEELLKEAVRLHSQAVYNLALRIVRNPQDAEDLVQETFAVLAREAGKIREPGALKTWLLRTAIRIAWKESARTRRRRLAEQEAAVREEGIGMEARSDLSAWISGALDRLPESLRLPLVLHYLEGLSHAEVAAVVGCPLGSVSTRMREGLEKLRKAAPAALGVLALAEVEEALGAVPVQAVPPGLTAALGKIAATGGMSAGAGIPMAALGGAAVTIKKGILVTAAILLLMLGIWMAREPGGPPARAAAPKPPATPGHLPAASPVPETAEVPRSSPAPVPEGSVVAIQPAVLVGRVFDRRTNRPIRNALVEWSTHGDCPRAFEDTLSQKPVAVSGDKMAEDDAIDGGCGGHWVSGPDVITLTNAEGRYRLEIPPALVSLSYDLEVVTETFYALLQLSRGSRQSEMRHGLGGKFPGGVDMTGDVVREHLGPAAGVVVLGAAAERASGMELRVEEPDAALDAAPALLEPLLCPGRVLELPVGSALGHGVDALGFELLAHGLPGPVGVVAEELALEGGLEERVEPLAVVALAGNLLDEGDAALRREDQVLTHPVEVALQRGAVAGPGQPVQAAVLFPGPDGAADVYGVGVDDEKGGAPSPANSQKAPQSFSMSGVRMARRSAKLGRESLRGNNFRMVGLMESHW